MKFGYVIVYVPDVAESLAFFEQAFGFKRKMLVDTGDYGELETGATTIAFASHELGEANCSGGLVFGSTSVKPLGVELAFVTPDVAAAHKTAVGAGATTIAAPISKPWGQTVSYVRCPAGTLIELCSPIT